MFCTKCGTKIGEGHLFCVKCGTKIKNESDVTAEPLDCENGDAPKSIPADVVVTAPVTGDDRDDDLVVPSPDISVELPIYAPADASADTFDSEIVEVAETVPLDVATDVPTDTPNDGIAESTAADLGAATVESTEKRKKISSTTLLLSIIAALLLILIVVLIARPERTVSENQAVESERIASNEISETLVSGNEHNSLKDVVEDSNAEPAPIAEALRLPQMDCSTARIPITEAIYEFFVTENGYSGPAPISSRTHGAWLNLADGRADIIFLVAPTEDELDYFTDKGVDIEMKVYGYDGLVFIGNQANPIDNLTTSQIRDIYSGRTSNWNQIGGTNSDILVYIRNPESGSQRLFESLVWDGYTMPDFSRMGFKQDEINPNVTQRRDTYTTFGGMEDIVVSVLINQYSIGFNIMSYIDYTFDSTALKLFSINGYMPTTENFASGNYPYLTTSYVAIRADEPADSAARQLYNWIGSDESYRIISENSTLTVSFSNSTIIRAGMGYEAPRGNASITAGDDAPIDYLANIITRLDKQYFTREDLLHFNLDELSYLRNGVYALSGYIFRMDMYKQYFNAQSWYSGVISSDVATATLFNEYQKGNLAVILARERELGG